MTDTDLIIRFDELVRENAGSIMADVFGLPRPEAVQAVIDKIAAKLVKEMEEDFWDPPLAEGGIKPGGLAYWINRGSFADDLPEPDIIIDKNPSSNPLIVGKHDEYISK